MRKMGMRAGRRKGHRRRQPVPVIDRTVYDGSDLDTKVALIRQLIPLGLLHVQETLEAEVTSWREGGMPARPGSRRGVAMVAIPGACGSAGSSSGSRFRVCAARTARYRL